MTRATDKPLRRLVVSVDKFAGETLYVVEITSRTLTIRPPKTRRGGPSEISVPWGAVYLRGMIARAEEARRAKGKRRRTRGSL